MKKLLRFTFAIVCLMGVASQANAQYVSSGPRGGAAFSFFRDNSNILVAGSGGIFQSNDDGRSWREVANSPWPFGCDHIYSVAASGPEMYAGTRQSGIFRSTDAGNTWVAASNGLRVSFGAPYGDIEIAGQNVLAIRQDSGFLFRSSDQGNNWVRHNLAIFGAFAQYICIHNSEVYISSPQGLFKSTDNGVNFLNINPNPADFGRLVWSGDTAYVGTSTGVKMSLDAGMSFSTVALSGREVRNLAVAGNNMFAVVRNPAPVQDSVLYSTNAGGSFSAAPFNSSTFRFTTVNDLFPTSNGVLVGTNYGLYGTASQGSSWGLADSGYNATGIRGLATAGSYVFAGAYPMGVYRVNPDNGPLSWQHSGDVSKGVDGNVLSIAAKGQFVHLGSSNGYSRSTDSGVTWTPSGSGSLGGIISSLYAAPSSSEVWMIRNGSLYYSFDDGGTFGQVVASNIPLGVAQRVMKADTALFVSSFSTLYKGGSTMAFSPVSGLSGYVTAVVYLGNTFYAATDGNGLYSSPNGATWNSVSIIGPLPAKINALILDSAGTGLIAGTDDGFYSNSVGGIWTRDGLAGHIVQSLTMRDGKLFVGTCSGAYSVPYKIDVPPIVSVTGTTRPNSGMEVWPNPARDNFSLRIQSAGISSADLLVRDVIGTIVLRKKLTLHTGKNEVSISAKELSLATGVYTIQVTGSTVQAAGRIVLY